MKILVITRNAWDNTNAIGNTMSNFFGGLNTAEFANVYFRSSFPNNDFCKRYYRTTEIEILKKWFFPQKIGQKFSVYQRCESIKSDNAGKKEKALIHLIHKNGLKIVYKFSDYLWNSKKWINKNFGDFVKEFSPDVVFTFAKSAPQYYLTVKFLKENFNVSLFTWIADDEYTSLLKNNQQREIKRLKYIVEKSDFICGCSKEICDYYNSIFGCNASPLYKGCELSGEIKRYTNNPIEIVYAGNLLYGRLDIIKMVAEAIEKYNLNGNKICFKIYSNTKLFTEEQKYFEQRKSSEYMGCRDYETIKNCLSEADLVLHVESFDEDQIIKTKYSFSTKIIDYLQSGSVILGIGPEEISSMKYIKTIPGTFVIEDLNGLYEKLAAVFDDFEDYQERAFETRKFAESYHDSIKNTDKIKEILCSIVGENK